MTKSVTVRQVAELMIADPTPKHQGWWTGYGSTCALGGVAKQLGVSGPDLSGALFRVDSDGFVLHPNQRAPMPLNSAIIGWNDQSEKSKAEIGQALLDQCNQATLDTVLWVENE